MNINRSIWYAGLGFLAGTGLFYWQIMPRVAPTPSKPKPVPALTTPQAKMVDGVNAFGIKLLQRQKNEGNVLLSPASVALMLSLCSNGAAGTTKTEIHRALGVDKISESDINRAWQTIQTQWFGSRSLTSANSLWYASSHAIEADYANSMKKFYNVQGGALDFQSPQAGETLDKWIADKTAGKIPGMGPWHFDADTVLVLLNALHFKSEWEQQFDAAATQDKDFYPKNGQKTPAPTMTVEGSFPYYKGKDFAMVKLPYKDAGFSLCVALPNEGVDVEHWIARLNLPLWKQSGDKLNSAAGHIEMPRFTITGEADFEKPLMDMGLATAFDLRHANFTRMRKTGDLAISRVRQKTMLEITEEGTQAAAATEMKMTKTADDEAPPAPFRFIANRPFLAALRDEKNGVILFWCVVRLPV